MLLRVISPSVGYADSSLVRGSLALHVLFIPKRPLRRSFSSNKHIAFRLILGKNCILYHKQYEHTSLRANILRAFRIVRLGILTYSVVVRSKNHRKISRPQVLRSFDRADFCPGEKKDAGNTPVFRGLLTMHERKDAGQNLARSYRLWYTHTEEVKRRYAGRKPLSARVQI